MHIYPITLKTANDYVKNNHRHHKPVIGAKFAIGAMHDAELVGVVICGRPVARNADDGFTLEVTRLATNGHKNACSLLYGAAARAAKALGYCKIQTYILDTENGSSLKASGWEFETMTNGGAWVRSDNSPRNNNHPLNKKARWAKYL